MRFASLGSGSDGNALVIEAGSTRVLLDCGFGIAEMERRLARLNLRPQDLDAILVTHEHRDHVGGVAKFVNKHAIPVWLTYGSLTMIIDEIGDTSYLREIGSHEIFELGDVAIQPFPVPHDAREPVQFVLDDGRKRLGVLTDTGHITRHIEAQLSGCAALVLECNHDAELLRGGPYPPRLKERIAGRFGHLDNSASAQLLSRIDCSGLEHLVAAHLSKQNNTQDHARAALAQAIGCRADWIQIADQELGFAWLSL